MRRSLAERRERIRALWRRARHGRTRAAWLIATLAAAALAAVGVTAALLWPRAPAVPALATQVETEMETMRERADRMELRLLVAELEGEIRSDRAPAQVRAAVERLRDRVGSVLPALDPSLSEDEAEAMLNEVGQLLATDPDGAADALAVLGASLAPPVAPPLPGDGGSAPGGADPDGGPADAAAEPVPVLDPAPLPDPAADPAADPAEETADG